MSISLFYWRPSAACKYRQSSRTKNQTPYYSPTYGGIPWSKQGNFHFLFNLFLYFTPTTNKVNFPRVTSEQTSGEFDSPAGLKKICCTLTPHRSGVAWNGYVYIYTQTCLLSPLSTSFIRVLVYSPRSVTQRSLSLNKIMQTENLSPECCWMQGKFAWIIVAWVESGVFLCTWILKPVK